MSYPVVSTDWSLPGALIVVTDTYDGVAPILFYDMATPYDSASAFNNASSGINPYDSATTFYDGYSTTIANNNGLNSTDWRDA